MTLYAKPLAIICKHYAPSMIVLSSRIKVKTFVEGWGQIKFKGLKINIHSKKKNCCLNYLFNLCFLYILGDLYNLWTKIKGKIPILGTITMKQTLL